MEIFLGILFLLAFGATIIAVVVYIAISFECFKEAKRDYRGYVRAIERERNSKYSSAERVRSLAKEAVEARRDMYRAPLAPFRLIMMWMRDKRAERDLVRDALNEGAQEKPQAARSRLFGRNRHQE